MHKIGCASTKKVSFLCLRLALPLQKIGCASTKKVNFLCTCIKIENNEICYHSSRSRVKVE
ncbi:hypothetical protein CJ232_05640 [Hoylesella timonensis]|uniref:Uncharacterized protein n=1 Tax=Hoylesella timonensis TaxID=386414 RepID=A0A2N6Q692_9BACT|nr:hypothetical protein CJ232_05640 [Hoylesella timonensis]